MPAIFTTKPDGNYLLSTTDTLAKVTTYGYNIDTGELEWVQYPEDTASTRTEYDYDTMYRMAMAECTTDTGLNQSVEYVYENDRLKEIETPTTAYQFGYGAFGQRSVVTASLYFLAYYYYTDDANRYLQQLEYGNYDTVNYTYDTKGRLLTQTYEDGDTVSYAYDNNGALATVTDSATGRTTTYYYDLTDRMMKYTEKGTNFSHSVGYEYDSKNNLTQLVENINGTDRTTSYTYDDDNRVETVTVDGSSVVYTYDGYGRVENQVTKHGTTDLLTKDYTFKNTVSADGQQLTSAQIDTYKVSVGNTATSYTYTYDGNGNILSVTVKDKNGVTTNVISYEYDSANQLIRENNQAGDFTHTWEYNAGGNILNRKEYGYTTGSLTNITPTNTITYTYDDVFWRDLLSEYDGKAITRDDIGNPLTYDGWTYTWEHGRQLASMTDGTTTWSYTYNADGLRTSKSNGTETWNYVYNGSQLTQMTKGDDTLYFTYDASGTPLTVTYNGITCYYETNLQGDVVAVRTYLGTTVLTYTYDAWGNVLSIGGAAKNTLGKLNPLLYRGYVYDQESGLYYVSSRYYDPEIGRWINADDVDLLGANGDFVSLNLFAYCGNNPISRTDLDGYFWSELKSLGQNFLAGAIITLAVAIGTITICSSLAATVSSGGVASPTILIAVEATKVLISTSVVLATTGISAIGVAEVGENLTYAKAGDGISEHTNGSKKWDKHTKKRPGAKEKGDDRRSPRINKKKRNQNVVGRNFRRDRLM